MPTGEIINPRCLCDFKMPWFLNRELCINRTQKLMVNAFKLATTSRVFWNLLKSAGRDGQLHHECDNLRNLEIILRYAHTGKIDIDQDNVGHVIKSATHYEVEDVLNMCEEFLIKNLSMDNYWRFFDLAKCYNLSMLNDIYMFMLENFSKISNTIEFYKLDFNTLKDVLDHDRINVKDELVVFDSIQNWIEKDSVERETYLAQLLNCLRLARLSLADISKLEQISMVKRLPPKFKTPLLLAKRQIIRFKRGMRVLPEAYHMSKPRLPYQCILVFGGGMFRRSFRKIKVYNNRDDTWYTMSHNSNLITGRVFFQTCVLDDNVYLLGGLCENLLATSSVFKFSLKSLRWIPTVPMYESRFFFAAIVLNNRIYAIGGHREGWETLSSVERYNPDYERWEFMAPMFMKRNRVSATLLDDKIFVCGGDASENGIILTQWLCSCEIYDYKTDQWTKVAAVPGFIWGCYKMVTVNEKVYLAKTCSMVIYDPIRQAWNTIKTERLNSNATFSLTELDGEIYRFTETCIDKWSPDDEAWQPLNTPIMHPGWGHKSVPIKGVSYVDNILSNSAEVVH